MSMRPVFPFRLAVIVLAGILCAGLGPAAAQTAHQPTGRTLHVAAAADLQPVLPDVLHRFEQQTGVHTDATYQSSATLTQQVLNGAPFDIFFAADLSYPQKLIGYGLTTEAKPVAYARGTLVLWARRDARVLRGRPLDFAVLRNPGLASVAIANPDQAPYGRAARAAMAAMHLDTTLVQKIRVAGNIAQAAQLVESGNAEVGFLSLTSALSPRLKADGSYLTVPPQTYPVIVQGAVVLKHGGNSADGERLMQFMATPAIRALLAKGGLEPAG